MTLAILRLIAEAFAPAFQEEFDSFLKGNARGLHLSFDDYWLAAASGRLIRGPWGFTQEWHEWREWHEWISRFAWDYRPVSLEQAHRLRAEFRHRFDDSNAWFRRSQDWDLRCRSLGYAPGSLPIVFRVIIREEKKEKVERDLPRSFEGFPIIYEARPRAVGLSASATVCAADKVGRSAPAIAGTAGGFLSEVRSNTSYLLSCAHVLGVVGDEVKMPGGVATSSGIKLGNVVYSVLPPPQAANTSCSGKSHPGPASLDVAIARLDPGILPDPVVAGVGKPTFITPFNMMKQGDQLTLAGQKSGHVQAEIDSLTVFHEIDIDNQPRCFGNIFSLCPPKPWYVNTKLVKSGDSGSWLLRSAQPMIGWDGVLVAGDGAHAYACYAEDAFNDARRALSSDLTLFP